MAPETGFYADTSVAQPKTRNYLRERPPIWVDSPAEKTVIIYSHGTTRPQRTEDCGAFWNRVPPSLLSVQSETTLLYYLCSAVTEPPGVAFAGQYVDGRLAEIERTLNDMIDAGVSPHRLFLAGHSAGGWVSLMAASAFPGKFNAAIAYAPAFAGRRSEAEAFPWWRGVVRPRQVARMLSAPQLSALVFAYDGDPFNRPEDLQFLADAYPTSVTLVAYGCANLNKHLVHLNDCRRAETAARTAAYLATRVGAASP
ncbi:MAG: alpha/beta hydrolase-fold protein [Pseudomonadota bacterium]